jgi:hypothetical protein
MMMGGGDEAATPAATPTPTPTGGGSTGGGSTTPVAAEDPCEPACANGGSCSDGVCTCVAGSWLNGGMWGGASCEDAPACSACGSDDYCGAEAGCDPNVPPEPVVAELIFSADVESAMLEPGSQARAQFENSLATDISSALGISPANIIIISLNGGSLAVKFAIVPDANFQQVEGSADTSGYAFQPAELLDDLAAMVADDTSTLNAAFAEKNLGTVQNTVQAITTVDVSGEYYHGPSVSSLVMIAPAHTPAVACVHAQ